MYIFESWEYIAFISFLLYLFSQLLLFIHGVYVISNFMKIIFKVYRLRGWRNSDNIVDGDGGFS